MDLEIADVPLYEMRKPKSSIHGDWHSKKAKIVGF
jgi:hypothetical protein